MHRRGLDTVVLIILNRQEPEKYLVSITRYKTDY